jgi:hypothetical protein
MADEHGEEHPVEGAATPIEEPAAATDPLPPQRRSRSAAPWLATLLILVIGGVASAPFWAPDVVPLLPWGVQADAANQRDAALAARVTALEQRPTPPAIDIDAVKSAQNALAHRIDQLETAVNARLAELEKHPAAPAGESDAVKSALGGLVGRIDQLEAASTAEDRRLDSAVAAEKDGLQQIEQRLAKLEGQSASLKADDAAAAQNTQQEFSRLSASGADLAKRLASLETAAQSNNVSVSELQSDAMLALLVAQMREAINQARPFPTEYDAYTKLAHNPELAAAGKPLAEAARDGVASRAVLAKRLAELSRAPEASSEPAAEPDWGRQALARLRGLVTIRRIDDGAQTGPEKALGAAQTELARGDLAGAVATLEPLTGAEAEAVRPWLRMARERLAVEAALDHIQELLTVRLGNPSTQPAAPSTSPQKPPQTTRTPS